MERKKKIFLIVLIVCISYLVGYLSAAKGDSRENENSLSEVVTGESVEETNGADEVLLNRHLYGQGAFQDTKDMYLYMIYGGANQVYNVDSNKIHLIDLVNLKLKSIQFPEKDKLVNVYYNLGYNDFV